MSRLWLLVVLAVGIAACGEPRELAGFVRTPAPSVASASLPDVASGERFDFVAPEDGLLVLYFGYTSCPDVCPTTLADLRTALEDLGGDADRIDVAMATVDPDRDTPEVLTGYLRSFISDARPLRTESPDELARAAEALGVVYDVSTTDEGDIEVLHSGNLYAVDDRGSLLVTWPFGVEVDDIRLDLEALLP
jgi:protein SCO1/2